MRKANEIKELKKRVAELEKQVQPRHGVTSIRLIIPDGCSYDTIEKKIHKRIVNTLATGNNAHIFEK